MKYVCKINSNRYSYRRRIPLGLEKAFGRSKFLVVALRTKDLSEANERAAHIDRLFERNVRAARSGHPLEEFKLPEATPPSRREYAMRLLDDLFGAKVSDRLDDIPEAAWEHLQDMLSDYAGETPSEISRAIDAKALLDGRGEAVRDEDTIVTIMDRYLVLKDKQDDHLFCKQPKYAVRDFINAVGNKQVRELKKIHVKDYIDYSKSIGLSGGTINRRLSALRAAVAMVNHYHDTEYNNVFIGMEIDHTPKKRPEITLDQFKGIRDTRIDQEDCVGLMIKLLALTGARTAEIVGLLWEDIQLDHEYPHIIIQEHDHRRLKNAPSARKVPILPALMDDLVRRQKLSRSKFLFKRYNKTKGAKSNTNSASGSMAKRLRLTMGLGDGVSPHSLRHSFISIARGVPFDNSEIISFIVGHAAEHNTTKRYGNTDLLALKTTNMLRLMDL